MFWHEQVRNGALDESTYSPLEISLYVASIVYVPLPSPNPRS